MNLNNYYINLNKVILLLFGLFPILPNKLKGLPVILLIINSILSLYIKKQKNTKLFNKNRVLPFFIMSSLFLFYLLTYFYTENISYFGKKLEIGLSLIIIPLAFYLNDDLINKKSILFFKKIYLFGITFFSIIFLSFIFIYKNERYPKGILDVNFIRTSVNHIPFIETHPIYVSVFLGIGILILISMIKVFRLSLLIPILILLVLSISILSSKMVIISLLIISLLFILVSNFRYKLLSILLVLLISVISIIYIPNLNYRFNELFKQTTYQEINKYNSSSIRNGINSCTLKLIKKSWLLGYGIGDVQNELNNCYESKSPILLQKQYNSHNQYLSIWLGTGIFGLLAFLYMLIYNFKLAIKNNDLLFISILIFFSINLLTENLLERQSGVILFAFLINFFGYYNIKKLKIKS